MGEAVVAGQVEGCTLSVSCSPSLLKHAHRTRLGSDPNVPGDVVLTCAFQRLQVVAFFLLLRMLCPREGDLEHAGRADKTVLAPSLYRRSVTKRESQCSALNLPSESKSPDVVDQRWARRSRNPSNPPGEALADARTRRAPGSRLLWHWWSQLGST